MKIVTHDNDLAYANKLFSDDFGHRCPEYDICPDKNNCPGQRNCPRRPKPKYDVHVDHDSTYLNPKINSKKKLIDWCLIHLGYPMLTVELTEEHFNVAIADALSLYSKYATFPTEYLAVCLSHKDAVIETDPETGDAKIIVPEWPGYIKSLGVDLSPWRVTMVKNISTIYDRNLAIGHDDMLFGWPLLMNGQFGGLPYFGGTNAFGQNFTGSFITYQAFYEFTSLARRIMGSNPDWRFDRASQRLIIIPEPDPRTKNNYALLEVECEPPIEELYGEEYFRRIVLAQCKIMLGTIRSKFGSVQLLGGGQINTDIGNEGREELKEIIDNIMRDTSIGQGFIIS